MKRADALGSLSNGIFDVLIIGGGITGACIARDAAMRGLRTALVEKNDFASGTSSRSSRLIHGGVRYLEHGQLHLVFESSRERATLLRIAPHLVRPLEFTWPVYRGARVPRWKLGIGLGLYDALSLFRNVERHQRLSARKIRDREPALEEAELLGGASYWDAATDDARLTLATALSAEAHGAIILNHARVTGVLQEGEVISGATIVEDVTGHAAEVRARIVVNAAGPWSDAIDRLAGVDDVRTIRASKGVHLMVERSRIANTEALTLLVPEDGRVMFVLPAGDRAIIGTTDTFEDVSPDDVCANEGDIAYLLAASNHYFPNVHLVRDDVISAWAGLRPLAAGNVDADDPGAVSREHSIDERAAGFLSVTGGKLTTSRAMAEEVTDRIVALLGVSRVPSRSADTPLAGAPDDVADEVAAAMQSVEDDAIATWLVHSYGMGWRAVWALGEAAPALRGRIDEARPYLLAAVAHAVAHEHAHTLADVLIRRIPLAFEVRDHGRAAAQRAMVVMAELLCWDREMQTAALERYAAEVEQIFRVREAAPADPSLVARDDNGKFRPFPTLPLP